MPRPTIDYLNARRALKPASGGTNYRACEKPVYAEDVELKDRQPFALRVDDGLYAALKAAGGVRALARLLGLSPQSIYRWVRGGVPHVPAKWRYQVTMGPMLRPRVWWHKISHRKMQPKRPKRDGSRWRLIDWSLRGS